jgi:phosphatidylglycerophosphatase C
MSKSLALFDFDGTITTRDTFIEFLIFYRGYFRFAMGMLLMSPVLALYVFKFIPNWKAKQVVLRWFLKGENLQHFNQRCREFGTRILPSLIRPEALEAIRQYQKDNTKVVVISASAENWVRPWCDDQGVDCLATQLEVIDNQITGNICGKNCYGEEKVNRLKNHLALTDFEKVIAYGDSSGDREMFAIAQQQVYKPFRTPSLK